MNKKHKHTTTLQITTTIYDTNTLIGDDKKKSRINITTVRVMKKKKKNL